jgi:drug/metabolite transporter (DMT)-like permease
MTSRTSARLCLLIAALLWSTSGVFLKSLPSVHWLVIAGLRSLFAAALFLPGLTQPRLPRGKLLGAALLYALMVSALMGSMQLGTAAQGIWLQYIAPAVVALWVWLVYRQRLRPVETLALVLTLVAIALIVTGGHGPAHQHSLLLGLLSGLAFGLFILLLKSLGDTPPAAIYLWTNLATAAILLPLALLLRVPLPTVPCDLVLLVAMGLAQLALPYYFFQWGLARSRPVEASLIILLEPILNPIWVYLVVGEIPSPRVIAGCALLATALVAVALFPNTRRQRSGTVIL